MGSQKTYAKQQQKVYDPWLAESMDAEPWTWRLTWDWSILRFGTHGALTTSPWKPMGMTGDTDIDRER